MQAIFQELTCSVRQWRRVPLPIAAMLLTLALAIGANTLLFAIANVTFLRALPYPDSSQLVVPSVVQNGRDVGRMDESTARLAEGGLPVFESFALYNSTAVTLVDGGFQSQ